MPEQIENPENSHPLQGLPIKPVKFVHEKCALFRTVHADGVWGMTNNQGNIQLNYYIDHEPLPDASIWPVTPNGFPTGEMQTVGKLDENYYLVSREFQIGVVLSLQAAKQVYAVLGNFIKVGEESVRIVEDLRRRQTDEQS